jgi:site-specific DNA-cytosine methylase
MVYPALKQIEVMNPAVVLVENVPNFKASRAGVMMGTTLRRMGYFLTEMVLTVWISALTRGENAITWWRRSSLGSFHRNLSRELVDDCGR